MTIDVASLVFEIDSTQAVVARERLEALERVGASVDAAASKTKASSDKANAAHREAATQITKLVEKVGAYEKALGGVAGKQGAYERAVLDTANREAAAWAKVEAQLERRNAAYRGDVAAQTMRASEQAALAEARALAQSAVAWEKIESTLERRNAALRGDLASEQALETARAAEKEAEAWRKVEAALEKRNAELRGSQALAAMKAEAAAATNLEARIDRLMNSIDPTRAAQARLNAEMQEASALYKAGAISASDYAKATGVLDARLAEATRGQVALNGVMVRGAASSKVATQAGLNLSRQFADIGVTAAMGMNPLMILIQQGPQIADAFAQAKSQGMGFSAVLATLQAQMAPFVALLAPIAIAAGATAAGFALLHRELSKGYPKDITDGLNLTEEQLERVEDRTVTMGDTFKATLDVMAKYLMQGPLGEAIDDLNTRWNAWLDDITANTVTEVSNIIGVFIGAYRTIVANWQNFPRVFGDLFAMGVNVALDAIEKLVNGAIVGLNKIFDVMRLAPQWSWLPTIGDVDLEGYKAQVTGAAEFTGKALLANIGGAIDEVRAGMGRLGTEIGQGAVKRAQDRALDDAGKPLKGSTGAKGRAVSDRSDERLAQLEQELARARADELQAQLALTEDVRARADLEKQILDIQLEEKSAELAKQAAKIERDAAEKRITETARDLLLMELAALELSAARVASLKAELIDREANRQAIHDDYTRRAGAIEDQMRVLESERDLAKYGYQRRAKEIELLKLAQQLERLKLEEIVATTAIGSIERERAEAEQAILDLIHGNQMKKAIGDAEDAFNRVAGAFGDAADAFRAQDWSNLVDALVEAFGALKDAFTRAGASLESKIGAVAGVASVVGGAVGGTAGRTISGAGSGAMAGATIGSIIPGIGTAIGAAIGAVVGGIGGFIGGKSEEKQARQAEELRRQQEAHAKALEAANQKRSLELRLLELQGKSAEALKLRREAELAAMDAGNHALALKIWALEDEAEAEAKAKAASEARSSLEMRLMEAMGDATGALAIKRQQELAATDETNRAMLRQVHAAEDVATAREALSSAYERESEVLRTTRDRMLDFVRSFKEFAQSLQGALDTTEAARLDRVQREFLSVQARAATGDEEAMRDLVENGKAFAAASEANAETLLQHQINIATIQNGMRAAEAAAQNQATIAEQQLASLDASVAGILQVNQSVLSVRDALGAYQAAVAQLAAAAEARAAQPAVTTPANDNSPSAVPRTPDWSSYLKTYPDVLAEFNRLSPNNLKNNLGVTSPQEFAKWHWEHYGMAEGRTPYATGGIMDRPITLGESGIGGEAGPEGILPLANVGGKLGVHASQGDQSELVAEVRALREEVAKLRTSSTAENQSIAKSNAQMARDVRQVVERGVWVHGETEDDPVETAA